MSGIRIALRVIGVAYAGLGLMVVLFAVNLRQRVDIGTAYLAVGVLAWGGTVVATGLSAGSVLGTLALVVDRCAGAWLACLGSLHLG